MVGKILGEGFDIRDAMFASNSVDRVLHRVGRNDLSVVAFAVRRIKVSRQSDVDSDLDEVVSIVMASDVG